MGSCELTNIPPVGARKKAGILDSGLVNHQMVAGVGFELTTFGLCALSPEPAEYNRQYFVFLAAGSAAELLTYGSYDEKAARSDSCVSARDGLLSM